MVLQRAVRSWLRARNIVRAAAELSKDLRDSYARSREISFRGCEDACSLTLSRSSESNNEHAKYAAVLLMPSLRVIPSSSPKNGNGNNNNGGVGQSEYQKMLADLEQRKLEEERERHHSRENEFLVRANRAKRMVKEAMERTREEADKEVKKKAAQHATTRAAMHKVMTRRFFGLVSCRFTGFFQAGRPKVWRVNSNRNPTVLVETENTLRARRFVRTLHELEGTKDADAEERLPALDAALDALAEFEADRRAKEVIDLVEREMTMLLVGSYRTKYYAGLRSRIGSGFARLMRSPDFNPEIKKFERVKTVYAILAMASLDD